MSIIAADMCYPCRYCGMAFTYGESTVHVRLWFFATRRHCPAPRPSSTIKTAPLQSDPTRSNVGEYAPVPFPATCIRHSSLRIECSGSHDADRPYIPQSYLDSEIRLTLPTGNAVQYFDPYTGGTGSGGNVP